MIENPISEFDQFIEEIGLTVEQREKANKLWGGLKIYIPIIPGSERCRRHLEVVAMLSAGKTYGEIESIVGLSIRQIRRIEAEERQRVQK